MMASRLLKLAFFAVGAAPVVADTFLPFWSDDGRLTRRAAPADAQIFYDIVDALVVMQDDYFEPWLGTWPTAIDWTAAVMGTHVSGALRTLSQGLDLLGSSGIHDYSAKENLVTTYFSQVQSFYFGQDAFGIRNQAFDDILWVVLGWLETIQFIDSYTELYYSPGPVSLGSAKNLSDILVNQTWYGNKWTPAFAHRARIFWDLGEQGWDTTLCGGGMNWDPHLQPYKNAITNELFIAASASMYLYFPGDANLSPFNKPSDPKPSDPNTGGPFLPHDKKYLEASRTGYAWLEGVGMLGPHGLYVDGFHIPGSDNVSNPNTRCTARDDMVYTYNQGVVLTGQRGLWEATKNIDFLHDGHRLIQAVINATGYDLNHNQPVDNITKLEPGELPPWHGLGRVGVLEEQCDVTGSCSQDSQTFKGIYFHHLTAFCAPLEKLVSGGATEGDKRDSSEAQKEHSLACGAYVPWIRHNALAALSTRDSDGKFGMWWTAGILDLVSGFAGGQSLRTSSSDGNNVDYRTYGVPQDALWTLPKSHSRAPVEHPYDVPNQAPVGVEADHVSAGYVNDSPPGKASNASDPNTRGRGRTVETQGGGLAVLRAFWEISHSAGK